MAFAALVRVDTVATCGSAQRQLINLGLVGSPRHTYHVEVFNNVVMVVQILAVLASGMARFRKAQSTPNKPRLAVWARTINNVRLCA